MYAIISTSKIIHKSATDVVLPNFKESFILALKTKIWQFLKEILNVFVSPVLGRGRGVTTGAFSTYYIDESGYHYKCILYSKTNGTIFDLIKLTISTTNTVKMGLEWTNEKYESFLSDFTSDCTYGKMYSPKAI